jgi:hypothetical protein
VTDIEDGYRAGIIPFDEAQSLLMNLAVDKYLTRYKDVEHEEDKIKFLRSTAISSLIDDAFRTFFEREQEIMEGKLTDSLLDVSRLAKHNNNSL